MHGKHGIEDSLYDPLLGDLFSDLSLMDGRSVDSDAEILQQRVGEGQLEAVLKQGIVYAPAKTGVVRLLVAAARNNPNLIVTTSNNSVAKVGGQHATTVKKWVEQGVLVGAQLLVFRGAHFRADLRVELHLGAIGIDPRNERSKAFAFDRQAVLQSQLDGIFKRQFEDTFAHGHRRFLGGSHFGLFAIRVRRSFLLSVHNTGRRKSSDQQHNGKITSPPSITLQFYVGAWPATHAPSPSFVSSSRDREQSVSGQTKAEPAKRPTPLNTLRLLYQAATGFPGDPVAPTSFNGDHAKANS